MGLSKADLLPDTDVYAFRDMLIAKVGEEIGDLREALGSLIQGDEALSVGEDFMLLSSARFDPHEIVVTERVGVELILPISAMLPFERHVSWARKKEAPGKVLEHLNTGVSLVAGTLIGRFIGQGRPGRAAREAAQRRHDRRVHAARRRRPAQGERRGAREAREPARDADAVQARSR